MIDRPDLYAAEVPHHFGPEIVSCTGCSRDTEVELLCWHRDALCYACCADGRHFWRPVEKRDVADEVEGPGGGVGQMKEGVIALTNIVWSERVTITRSQLANVGDLCEGIVTRGGIEDACCKDATTVIYDAESASVWAACTWHAHRYGGALTLAQMVEARTTGSTSFEREVAGEW